MKRVLCSLVFCLTVVTAWAGDSGAQVVARIAFLADVHVTFRTNGLSGRFGAHFDKAITDVNAAKVDLVLIAGDLTDNGTPEQMDAFRKKIKGFKAPVIFIPGNHDVGHGGSIDKPRTITPERVQAFSSKLGKNYFERTKAGVRVIGINSCLLGTGLEDEQKQWKFLEKELAKPSRKPTILMEHYPLFVKAIDEPSNGVWNAHPEPRKRIIGLLEKGGVHTVLSGHLHRHFVNRANGILFLSNRATAYGLPHGKEDAGWMLLTVPRTGEVQFELKNVD